MNNNFLELKNQIISGDFDHLNNMQKEAVLTVNGPVLILAGAGSGKTTVLINRIVNMLSYSNSYFNNTEYQKTDEQLSVLNEYASTRNPILKEEVCNIINPYPIKPWQILAITFTNKAAKELKERLETALGEEASSIWAQTFHATCTRILRKYAEHIGYSNTFTIYDEDDKKRVILEIIRSKNLDEKKFDPKMISGAIGRAKDNLQNADGYRQEISGNYFKETIADIYKSYEKRLFTNNAMDFDDIIAKTVLLLSTTPEVLEYYQNRFKYIMVDEYQDTNHAQYKLIKLLGDKHKNVCVVGDDDQSIYKFRGATITNILDFEKDYDNALTIRLEQNYRSTSEILTCANELIAKNTNRKGKNLWTDKTGGKKVRVLRVSNQDEEARTIANQILEGVADGNSFSDYAILYRNHALSNAVENALKRQAIPYKIFSGLRFFDRAEVRDMIAYLWVINNPADSHRLKRIVNTPARKISSKTVEVAEYIATENDMPIFDILKKSDTYDELSRPSNACIAFTTMIEELRQSALYSPLDAFYDEVLEKTGYARMLQEKKDDPTYQSKLENVYELKSSIIDYISNATETPSLNGFLEEISLFTDLDRNDESQSAITMLTIHSAKGLEFPNVFICGLDDGIFPSFKSMEEQSEIEEERRLAYVAITRAKQSLTLTCCESRLLYGKTQFYKPSLFITEIPTEHIDSNISKGKINMINSEREFIKSSATSFGKHSGVSSVSVGANKKPSADVPNYATGEQIKHKAFGVGMIISTKPMGGDILLEIAFEDVGTKRLLSKTASSFITKI